MVALAALVAEATVPETFAPATALADVAFVAKATVPVTLAPVNDDNPDPLPVNMPEFAVILTAVIKPFTFNPVNIPILVILPCAAVVTVPAVVALDTVPETLAPATEFALVALVANATAPLTLAPATEFALVALVAKATAPDTLAPATEFAVVAYVANATAPLTFAPVKLDILEPLPAR